MNLLEHFIDQIISEQKVRDPENGKEYYRVTAVVDCYGQKEQIDQIFPIDKWEQAKADGYYMA